MRNGQLRLAMIALAGLLSLLVASQPAEAQLGTTVYGVGEFDDNDVVLVLAGVSFSLQRQGWSPVVDLQGHWLQYPTIGRAKQEVIAVTPSIGLKRSFTSGEVQFRAGYSFQDEESGLPSAVVDIGSGVINVGQLEYWGTGRLGAQAIATYNYGSETFWGRGRLTHRLFGTGAGGQVRLGGEAAYLTTSTGDASFESIQIGGLVGYQPGRGVIINAGVGRKLQDFRDATYFKIEFVFVPIR